MKLLFCTKCQDMIKMTINLRGCTCGASSGYIKADKVTAVINGPMKVVGINDKTFYEAVNHQPRQGYGKEFTAFILPHENKSIIKA